MSEDKIEIEVDQTAEAFTDELSDEALDRVREKGATAFCNTWICVNRARLPPAAIPTQEAESGRSCQPVG